MFVRIHQQQTTAELYEAIDTGFNPHAKLNELGQTVNDHGLNFASITSKSKS